MASLHLNLSEENFVPDAVAADDPPADLRAFSLRGEVEQPALQRRVRLAEDLQQKDNSWGCFQSDPNYLFRGVSQSYRKSEIFHPAHPQTSSNQHVTHNGLEASSNACLTLSYMRLSKRGTTGKMVGLRAFMSSGRRRMSPW